MPTKDCERLVQFRLVAFHKTGNVSNLRKGMTMKNVNFEELMLNAKVKSVMTELVIDTIKNLQDSRKCVMTTYDRVPTGEMKVKERWDSSQRKLVTCYDEETGEVLMEEEYKYVDREKRDDELDESDCIKLKAYDSFIEKLCSML